MSVNIRLDPRWREMNVLLPEALDARARSHTLATFAREQIDIVDDENARIVGHKLPYDTYVDGREDAPLASVRPDGRIEALWTFYEEMFVWIDQQLILHSPVGRGGDDRPGHPGLYMRSHEFTADGDLVDRSRPIPPADEYVFVSTQPYARKIERGLSAQAPAGVYQTVAALASRRWGNLASIRFGFRSPLFGHLMDWAQRTRLQPKGRTLKGNRRQDWLTRQPAIVIRPR